jgi:hypothetical protein
VTRRTVGELEAGRFPWVQPWGSTGTGHFDSDQVSCITNLARLRYDLKEKIDTSLPQDKFTMIFRSNV